MWADCATFGEGLAAHEAGADIISTTLYGYTAETALPKEAGPGLDLLKEFVTHIKAPIILEGRIWHPDELTRAFELGAHAVVVGSAITRPQLITERFVKAIPSRRVKRPHFNLQPNDRSAPLWLIYTAAPDLSLRSCPHHATNQMGRLYACPNHW